MHTQQTSEYCLFPTLNDGELGSSDTSQCTIGRVSSSNLQAISASPDQFLRAVWVLVVHQFVPTDCISFEYAVRGDDTIAGVPSGDYSCTVPWNDRTRVQSLLRESISQLRTETVPAREVNTRVVLQRTIGTLDEGKLADTEYILTLLGDITDDGLLLQLRYRTTHISHGQARNIASVAQEASDRLLTSPDSVIGDLDLFSDANRRDLQSWNDVDLELCHRCVHNIVEDQARNIPDDVAVCAWDGQLTYRELDDLATAVARYLHSIGVQPERFVAFYMDKSVWAVVAMVAVLKAGGVCVPLSPTHPMDRTRMILEETKAEVAITDDYYRSRLQGEGKHVVVVDCKFVQSLGQVPDTLPIISPRNAAFLMYTSGSTGRPKGVLQEHASIYTKLRHMGRSMGMTTQTRCFQFASFTFDPSICDIFSTMMFGGCVCVPSEQERLNNLAGCMRAFQVTFACLTAATLAHLHPDDVPTLTRICIGGDSLSEKQVLLWGSRLHLNVIYGTTETAVWDSIHPGITRPEQRRNIGRGFGCAFWIVDKDDPSRLVPVGAVGELLVEGPSLAREYWNDPAKTAPSFIEAPAWLAQFRGQEHKTRLYKTGDLVRYNSDGTIEYIGRKDSQVKIRGQRVELEEIEQAIKSVSNRSMHAVASVIPSLKTGGHEILTAFLCVGDQETGTEVLGDTFVAPNEASRREIEEIKTRLVRTMPSYMIPVHFILVSRLQLTTSGKVDRKALVRGFESLACEDLQRLIATGGEKRRPRTAIEERLHGLYAKVLAIDHANIGADDDFFLLGGDSLKAMALVEMARQSDIQLTVATIFQNPKISDLARLAREASPNPNSEISPFSLLHPESTVEEILLSAESQCGVSRQQIEDVYPCTPLQEGLIALTMKNPRAYRARFVYELHSGIDLGRFRGGWEKTMEANPILRTRIIQTESRGSFQVVLRASEDWSKAESYDAYLEEDSALPMSPGHPLVHFTICSDDKGKNLFVVTLHHALFDGWSFSLILEQIAAAYEGTLLEKREFSPFIRYLSNQDREISKRFWKEQFRDLAAALFPPVKAMGYTPSEHKLLEHFVPVSQAPVNGITMATMIRLAWAFVVAQHTDCEDVIFGTTVTGRAAAVHGIEKITGPTIATIPIRIRLPAQGTVLEALEAAQQDMAATIPHEQFGLQAIRHVSPEANKACQFQNMLVVQPEQRGRSSRLMVESAGTSDDSVYAASYALCLVCELETEGVKIQLWHDKQALGAVQAERILFQFARVLMQIRENPDANVNSLCAVSSKDIEQLREWNGKVPSPVEACAHDLIDLKFKSQPEAPAVCAWDGTFTYKELDDLSSTLAEHLQALGVEPEVFVPLCFEKSKWTIVAMLAVMKAGGAFVLLDPGHPTQRLQDICAIVNASVILSSTTNTERSRELAATQITVDENGIDWNRGKKPQRNTVQPWNALYVVFTSGSTGKPKAVVIEHRNYCSSVADNGSVLQLNSGSRVLHFASYAFDISIMETVTTLVFGGCICIPSEHDRQNDIAKAARELDINWAAFTPSTVRLLRPESIPSLKTLFLGGEPATRSDIQVWADKVDLNIGYGPAECAISCAVQPKLHRESDPLSLGRLTNSVGWIVDQNDYSKLMPIGTVGELLIEGPIVAREYLKDPKKTTASFIEDPPWLAQFRARGGQRLYRTSDLVKYNADGSLRFVGRRDTQVKIRGQRVELGEIEHHLRQVMEEVDEVIVEAFIPEGSSRGPTLTAFTYSSETSYGSDAEQTVVTHEIFAKPDSRFLSTVAQAEASLQNALPSYMVPVLWIPLKKIPKTRSGKTDRKNLREMAASLSREQLDSFTAVEAEKVSPSTPREQSLRELFSRALNIPAAEIGANDHFFRLGGDSVTAMKLVGLARETGMMFTVADVFRRPKLSDLATIVKEETDGQQTVDAFSLLPSDDVREELIRHCVQQHHLTRDRIEDIYPCTALQAGLMALTIKREGAYVMRTVYRLPDDVDMDRFQAALKIVAEKNPILRTRIVQYEPQGMFQVVVRDDISCDMADDLNQYAAEESKAAMKLGDPLSKFAVGRGWKGGAGFYFMFTLHHAVYDGWSLPLILDQIEAAYNGSQVQLRPFNHFIEYTCKSDNAAAEDFWRAQFANLQSTVFPSLPNHTYTPAATRTIEHRFQTSSLVDGEFTLSTALRLAWAILVSRYTSSNDVVFGVTVSGRSAPVSGIEMTTGPTIATVPVRVQVKPEFTVKQLLMTIQDRGSRMIPFEQMGLQKISRLGPEAALACQFQSLLVIQPPTEHSSMFRDRWEDPDEIGNFNSYALLMACELATDLIQVRASYDENVVPEAQMARLLRQFAHVFQRILEKVDQSVGSISALSYEDELQLRQWNGALPSRDDARVEKLISEHSLRRPMAQAVCAWDGNLTYSELNSLSTQLAMHLVDNGVTPESFVPLYFHKSKWTVVSMLAVLKAGAAFCLLDLSHPLGRLQEVCNALQPRLILTSADQATQASQFADLVVAVDDDDATWRTQSLGEDKKLLSFSSESAMYAVFTSGSTGKPKGVVIEQAAFCTGAKAHGKAINLSQESRFLQFASYAFDASILETLSTLIHGGCVCIPSESDRNTNLAAAINQLQVNHALLTPSVSLLLKPEEVPGLETLVLGGEAMSQTHVNIWEEKVHLMNSYGPAECSVVATVQSSVVASNPANIGHATGCATWVVDCSDADRLAPLGAVGELLIEGATVGRGYLHDPERTAAAFIDTPSWLQRFRSHANRGSRLYKTGDLVQYEPDGSLRYVGRKDHQVKIRGQRVELGEIERCFQDCLNDSTKEVIAEIVTPAGENSKPLLAAFVCTKDSPAGSSKDAKSLFGEPSAAFSRQIRDVLVHVRELLPGYMVPTVVLPLLRIPLSVSGKTDRKLIREQASSLSREELNQYAGQQEPKHQPSTPEERVLQRIIAAVLNVPADAVGVDDSFFHLGGDSISAMQLCARCRREGFELSVPQIFEQKTVARLAMSLAEATRPQQLQLDEAEHVACPFELSPVQQLFFASVPRGHNHFNQSFFLRLARPVASADLSSALEALVARHSMLRARFAQDPDEGAWKQTITTDASASYRLTEHRVSHRSQTTEIFRATQGCLDVNAGPLLAAVLVDVEGDGQYLYLVCHHLVVDLVSWRIILQELDEFLQTGAIAGDVPLSFQTWCRQQATYAREHLSPENALPFSVFRADEAYWGMDGRSNTFGDVLTGGFSLDQHATRTLLGVANKAFQTQPVDVFHAALVHSFAKVFSDRTPPSIFTEGHGREQWNASLDVSRTVGWFTTIWPVTVETDRNHDIAEVVRRTKDSRRKVPKNGWAYFASRYLNARGREAFHHHSPVEVLFNYEGHYQQLERDGSLLRWPRWRPDVTLDIAADFPRWALFDVSASVENGFLHFSFAYSRHMLQQDRIRQWVDECKRSLQEAAKQLVRREPEPTLIDFPRLPITYEALDRLLHTTLPQMGIVGPNMVEDIYPCSPVQQGMLMSQIKNHELYKTSSIFEVIPPRSSEPIDMERLVSAWQSVVDRHSILRTVFVEDLSGNGAFDQLVLRNVTATSALLNSHTEDGPSLLANSPAAIHEPSRPPHRLLLCRTPTGRVFCKLEISHLLTDGTSSSLLIRNLQRAYHDRLPGRPALPYGDYVSYLQSLPTDTAVKYWKERLTGVEPCVLPSLGPEASRPGSVKNGRYVAVEIETGSSLSRLCGEHGVTLSNIFQLAWALVLRAYTGSDTICFGFLTSGREVPLSGIEDAVGPFISMLICRMDLDQKSSLLSMVRKAQQDFTDSLPRQHCPLGEIFHALGLKERSLFNTVMSLQHSSSVSTQDGDIAFEWIQGDDPTEYDITVNILTSASSTRVFFAYDPATFSDVHVRHVANAFSQAVSEISTKAERSLSDVDLFNVSEDSELAEWAGKMPEPIRSCAHELIHQRVLSQPEAPAVCAWDGDLTYRELDSLSTQLALHLIDHGVEPERPVPIYLEKSKWVAVAILGVIKAGAPLLLLEPSHPIGRLEEMCNQVRASLIVASPQTVQAASNLAETVVTLDESVRTWSRNPEDRIEASAGPDNALCLVFTSGSTGKPKGIVLEHAAFCTSAISHAKVLGITSESRVFQFASYAFDASILEVLTTLIHGGCVCVPSWDDRQNNLVKAINQLQANWILLTPSASSLIRPEDVPTLQTLLLAGEAMTPTHIGTWCDKVRLMNGYGPAECSVLSTIHPSVTRGTDCLNLGRPTGCTCWVVDPNDHQKLTPIGAIGELLIEGPIVGRGYINNVEKTAAAFIDQPSWLHRFQSSSRGRLYKTGDLVRYHPDGSLIYIGRKDTQVKLRGQRLELGEVERSIQRCVHQAQDVIVEMITPKEGTARVLVAFLMMQGPKESNSASIFAPPSETFKDTIRTAERHLREHLPGYMVPSFFIPLVRLPLGATGKADRRLLRELASQLPREELRGYSSEGQESKRRVASTPVEQSLVQLVTEVLHINPETVSMDDSFFSIGGDSISAMHLVRGARRMGFSFAVADVFKHPQLSDLASILQGGEHERITNTAGGRFSLMETVHAEEFVRNNIAPKIHIPCDVTDIEDVFLVTDFQRSAIETRNWGYFILHLRGRVSVSRLQSACQSVVQAHSVLRTVFVSHNDDILQVILRRLHVPFVHREAAGNLMPLVKNLCEADAALNVPVGGSMIQFTLIQGSESESALVVRLSHAQYDGISMSVLYNDLATAYRGEPVQVTFEYTAYLRQYFQQQNEAGFTFWRDLLRDSTMTYIRQPSDRSLRGLSESVRVTRTEAMPHLPSGITMATLVKAAWALTLAHVVAQSDIVFGQLVNGRGFDAPGMETTVGPCVNYIPVRVQMQPSWTARSLLTAVQKQHTESMPFESVGFQNVVKHSTTWAKDTRFGSIVHHQNIAVEHEFFIGEAQVSQSGYSPLPKFPEVWLLSSPSGYRLKIDLLGPGDVLDERFARQLLDEFAIYLAALARNPDTLLLDTGVESDSPVEMPAIPLELTPREQVV